MPNTNTIPHDVVTEFIGQASFSPNGERDVEIAEQIASQSYNSLEDLVKTCKGSSSPEYKFEKAWDKAYQEATKPESWFQKQLNPKKYE